MSLSDKSKLILTDDGNVNQDDTYRVSINNIVVSYYPETIQEFLTILNSSGYYGRAEIIRQPSILLSGLSVKVRVYLPNSRCYYEWPYGSSYNLSKSCFNKRKKPAVITPNWKLLKCMYFLAQYQQEDMNIEKLAETGTKIMGWATKDEYVRMISFLSKVGLFRKGKFSLKHLDDVEEVHNNLFDYNYFCIV